MTQAAAVKLTGPLRWDGGMTEKEASMKPTSKHVTVKYTKKQMGDACEMLVAAELTLAGVPSMKGPDNWPGYDVIAQPTGKVPQRVSVKSRTFKRGAAYVGYEEPDGFEWLAIVILPGAEETRRRVFVIPRYVADAKARRDSPTAKTAKERYWRVDEVAKVFATYENNFALRDRPSKPLCQAPSTREI
jgi:hypothetical protein